MTWILALHPILTVILAARITVTAAESAIVCAGDHLKLSCPSGQILMINAADYGRAEGSSTSCPNKDQTFSCAPVSAVEQVQHACLGKQDCSLVVSEATMPNTACPPSAMSYLHTFYNCIERDRIIYADGKRHTIKHRTGYIVNKDYPKTTNTSVLGEMEIISGVPVTFLPFSVDLKRADFSSCQDSLVFVDAEGKHARLEVCSDILTPKSLPLFRHPYIYINARGNHKFLVKFQETSTNTQPSVQRSDAGEPARKTAPPVERRDNNDFPSDFFEAAFNSLGRKPQSASEPGKTHKFIGTLGFAQRVIVCDDEEVEFSCPENKVLVFEVSNYGRTTWDVCKYDTNTECINYQTTGRLNSKCFGQTSCKFTVSPATLWDYCVGVPKYLEATFICVDEKKSIFPVCGQPVIDVDEGYVISPYYPAIYKDAQLCSTQIAKPSSGRVRVEVLDVDMEMEQSYGCRDYLFVQEANEPSTKNLYCESLERAAKQKVIYKSHPELVFEADNLNNHFRGFLVKFKVETLGGFQQPPELKAAQSQRLVNDDGEHYQLVLNLRGEIILLVLCIVLVLAVGRFRRMFFKLPFIRSWTRRSSLKGT